MTTKHIVRWRYDFGSERTGRRRDDKAYWNCSCGTNGVCRDDDVEQDSDRHIDYDGGDRRVDRGAR